MGGAAALLCCAGLAQAQVDLSTLDADLPTPRAQVLVLGTMHLSNLPADFDIDALVPALAPVLDRLAAYRPDVITIESISGEGCDLMARHPGVYGPAADNRYCGDTDAARAATGLDVPAAIAAVRAALRDAPATPSPAQRRHLAALFLAANERESALVQWWQLPDAERRAGDGLDAALVTELAKLATNRGESLQIAARLAARLGLPFVVAIDDHTGDNIDIPDSEVAAFSAALQHAWDAAPKPRATEREALTKRGDMLALYRYMNRPDVLRGVVDADFGAALRDPSPQHYGQRYVAGWETRNLRMVANIRAAFRERPGARVLSIVGSSHKPWFDSLLGQMQGVDIVDVEQTLRAATQSQDPTPP